MPCSLVCPPLSPPLTHTHTVVLGLEGQRNLMTRLRNQNHTSRKRKAVSQSLCSLWLISSSFVRNAFFGSPLSILLTYRPFQPLSVSPYFQLLEEFGLEVDQSTPSYSKALAHSHKTNDVIDVLDEHTNMIADSQLPPVCGFTV